MDLNLLAMQGKFMAVDAIGGVASGPKFGIVDLMDKGAEAIIEDYLKKFIESSKGKRIMICLDGIFVLPAIGWEVVRVMRFLKRLETLANGNLIVRINRNVTQGNTLIRWLVHRFPVTLIVRSLSSGLINRTVHGELHLHTRSSSHSLLFRCTDSTVLCQAKSIDGQVSLQALLD